MSRYVYVCAKCGGAVRKDKVGASGKGGNYHGLHGWSCEVCGDGVKVARTMRKANGNTDNR
jgi:DNA-directed RNA polymerase subunit RPC12/RpoP